jgi:hypothetical protein
LAVVVLRPIILLAEAAVTHQITGFHLLDLLLVVEHRLVQTVVITVMVVKAEVFQDSLITILIT